MEQSGDTGPSAGAQELEVAQRLKPRPPSLLLFPARSPLMKSELISSPSRKPLEHRLASADQRREEFKAWALEGQAKTNSTRGATRDRVEQRRLGKVQALQERHAAAHAARATLLDHVRHRAATTYNARRGEALSRVQQRAHTLALRLAGALTAAEERRNTLFEAERARLRAEHELVLTRLAQSREEGPEAGEARARLEQRLAAAERQRAALLDKATQRAGGTVQHAKEVSSMTRTIREQQSIARAASLRIRLEAAEARRKPPTVGQPLRSPRGAGGDKPSGWVLSPPSSPSTLPSTRSRSSVQPSAHSASGMLLSSLSGLRAVRVISPLGQTGVKADGLEELTGPPAGKADDVAVGGRGLDSRVARLVADVAEAAYLAVSRPDTPLTPAASTYFQDQGKDAAEELEGDVNGELIEDKGDDEIRMEDVGGEELGEPEDEADTVEQQVEALRVRVSTRKLQAAWRHFAAQQRTTAMLSTVFVNTGVTSLQPSCPVDTPTRAVESGSAVASQSPASPPPGAVVVGGFGTPTAGLGSPASQHADKFDEFAHRLQKPATLRAATAILRRLEARLKVRLCSSTVGQGVGGSTSSTAMPPVNPMATSSPISIAGKDFSLILDASKAARREGGSTGVHLLPGVMTGGASEKEVTRLLRRLYPGLPKDRAPDRYPPRILLCALMIIKHPEVVFNGKGQQEEQLAAAAVSMVDHLERLLLACTLQHKSLPGASEDQSTAMLASSPVQRSMHSLLVARNNGGSRDSARGTPSIAECLMLFDAAWLQYLDQFAAWKLADADALETELIRMAAEMERSLARKVARSLVRGHRSGSDINAPRSARNLDQVADQVAHDHSLLRDRVERLGGQAGLARLDHALALIQAQVAAEVADETEDELTTEGGLTSGLTSGLESASASDAEGTRRHSLSPAVRAPIRAGMRRGFFGSGPRTAADATPSTNSCLVLTSTGTAANPLSVDVVRQPMEVWDVRAPSVSGSLPVSGLASPQHPSPLVMSENEGDGVRGMETTTRPYCSPQESVIANLQMVWELLHDPGHKMPGAEAEAAWARACLPAGTQAAKLDLEELESMGAEDMVAALRSHARTVAEAAFWQGVTQQFYTALQAGKLAEAVSGLLSELGVELASALPDSVGAPLAAEFQETLVREALTLGVEAGMPAPLAALQATAGRMQRLAGVLLQSGAPAREEEATVAHTRTASELSIAISAAVPSLTATTRTTEPSMSLQQLAMVLGHSLRLISAQIKLLKLDTANARLQVLAVRVSGGAGVGYVRQRFTALHRLPANCWEDSVLAQGQAGEGESGLLAARLPRASGWLTRASAALPGIEEFIRDAGGLDLGSPTTLSAAVAAAAEASAAAAVPTSMRSGLRAGPATGGASFSAGPSVLATTALAPCVLHSWRGVMRTGVVALICSDTPAVGPALAEVLSWDAGRLHTAQNAMQRLVVVTAALLLVQQTRARAGQPSLSGPQAEAARRRLLVVLADPSMSLSDLVTELHRLATLGVAPSVNAAEAGGAEVGGDAESALGTALRSLLDPRSAAFRAVSNALAAALAVHLVVGPAAVAADAQGKATSHPGGTENGGDSGAEDLEAKIGMGQVVEALLARVGAWPLAQDVAALAALLSELCLVSEHVFAPVYRALCQV